MKKKHIAMIGVLAALLLANVLLVGINYGKFQGEIPTHYGPSGNPDAWGSKNMLLLYPGLQALFLLISLVIYKYPNYVNVPSTIALKNLSGEIKEKAYEIVRDVTFITLGIVSFLMLYLNIATIQVAKGQVTAINNWVTLGILVLLAPPIIYYAIKMRRLG